MGVSWKFQVCFNSASKKFQGSVIEISKVFQRKNISTCTGNCNNKTGQMIKNNDCHNLKHNSKAYIMAIKHIREYNIRLNIILIYCMKNWWHAYGLIYVHAGWSFPREPTNFGRRKFSKSQEILKNMH